MTHQLQPCGTWAAAKRHRRKKEPVCQACRRAEADYQASRKAARESKLAKKVVVMEALEPKSGELDPRRELLAMYDELGKHLQVAPPNAAAGIVKQRVAILEMLTKGVGGVEVSSADGGGMDELAKRRKARRAAT